MMFRRLKYTMLVSAAAGLLTACQSGKDEPRSTGNQVVFTTEVVSRSSVTGNSNITDHPFVVYGDMINMEGGPDHKILPVLNGDKVSYNASTGQWTYDEPRFWFPGFQHSFVALHPANSTHLSTPRYIDSELSFTYTQPLEYTAAPDLLVSAHRRNYTDGKTDAVRFGFSHILTNVNVEVIYNGSSTDPTHITIDDITLRNIPVSSTYAITPAQILNDYSSMTTDWVNPDGSQYGWTVGKRGDLVITFPAAAPREIQSNGPGRKLFTDRDALLLLPNPDDPDMRAELEMNYTASDGEKNTVTAVIPVGWDPATAINLLVSIDNGKVQFSFTVEDWKDGSTTNTTVPRK